VGREALLEDILKQIEDQTHKPSIQHFILIGPRGIGKTNLMQMIKYRIQDDPQMKDNWLPVVFSEEDFEIYGIRSFFEKIIDMILEESPSESFLSEFEANRLLEDNKIAIEKSMVMIQKLSDNLKKQFIVFVDNLDSLLMEQLPDDLAVKKLRKFLTTNNSILLFGGAIKVFDEILSYNEPLFSHFAPIELRLLDYETIEAFIKGRAEYEGEKDILNNFNKFRSKIKAVSDLTGGNPRLILILYEIISEKEFDAAVEILMGVMDDMTSYYQDILKNLPAKERKVLDTIMRSEIKMTSTSLSSTLRWKQNEISSLLKRLRERQIVEGKKASKGREVYYETTDSVFRIFYQMRYLNKQRRRLGFIIDFLQRWYSLEELREKARDYKNQYEKCFSEASLIDASEKLERAFYFADASLKMGFPESHLDLIETCISKRNLSKAMEELEDWKKNIKKTNESELSYLWYKAWIYDEKQEYKDALKCIKSYVVIKPDEYDAWYNVGTIHAKLKQFDKAVFSFEKAVEIKPDEFDAWYSRGNACAKLKQFDKAVASFEKAVEINPDSFSAWNNMGDSCDELKQFDKAVSAYEKAIEINPDSFSAWNNKGFAYSELKQFDKAVASFEKAVEINTDSYIAWNNMGNVCCGLKQFDKAVASFEKAVEINPDEHDAWYNMGNAYEKLMQFDKAVYSYEKAAEIKPDSYYAWNNKGIAYGELKQFDKAVSAYKKAIEIKPDGHETLYNMGKTYAYRKDFSQSLMLFNKCLDSCKKNEIPDHGRFSSYFEFFYDRLHISFNKKEKSQYFAFFKESLEIIKEHSEIDYFPILQNFYILLLKDSEFSFFNDCFEETETVLGGDEYNSLSFFKTAASYLETKDISILERLNLEERKPVDLILKEIEKKKKV
jgi:tetratricopeptide (TPR) repeat protein